jgi:FMN phosphatase YigB (HAD superfamily)
MAGTVGAVYFDIGETILDRTREYAAWARWLGVPSHTFSAVFGAVIAGGGAVRDVIAYFGSDFDAVRAHMDRDGAAPRLIEADLYPDVRTSLAKLRQLGLRVGIAGNQPGGLGEQLRALDLPIDEVSTSTEWELAKPSPAFFERIAQSAGLAPSSIVYVGDQIDNDIVPAHRAGLLTVRIRRGPWGYLVRDETAESVCLAVISSLTELPGVLAGLID